MVYDIKNLLYFCPSPFLKEQQTKDQVICDIDKTYLETQTSTLLGLARTALERSEEKITIEGAQEFINALIWQSDKIFKAGQTTVTFPKNLHFVSASPPQIRSKIEGKFLLDQLCWSSITLKNQLYNIKKIKFKLLREQISFKTLAILNLIAKNSDCSFYLIGDNSESDPYIYSGLKLLKDKNLSYNAYIEFLKMADLTKESIKTIVQTKGFIKSSQIKHVFIRDTKNGLPSSLDHYVTKFKSYKKLFLFCYKKNLLKKSALWSFLENFYCEVETKKYAESKLLKDLKESSYSEKEAQDFLNSILMRKEPQFQKAESKILADKKSEDFFLEKAEEWLKKERHIE